MTGEMKMAIWKLANRVDGAEVYINLDRVLIVYRPRGRDETLLHFGPDDEIRIKQTPEKLGMGPAVTP
jgi:hypothetical protein